MVPEVKVGGSGSVIVTVAGNCWEKLLLPGENLRELLTVPPALAAAFPSWLQQQKLWREL